MDSMFPTLGFAVGQPTAKAAKVAAKVAVGGKKTPAQRQAGKPQSVSVQQLLAPQKTASPFADDAVADAAMLWIPSNVVRAESWRLDKDSDVLTTVYTCSGRSCRKEHRWRQFGRAAECLEHLAQEEGFRFLTCQHEGCGEVVWANRMRDHCAHAHPATKAQRPRRVTGKGASQSARKAGRQAAAAAAPGGIVMRGNGWTKAAHRPSSAASDSGVSVTSSAASPAMGRRATAPPSRVELRRKVLAWDAVTMAGRSAPLVVKKHYCSHADCSHSSRAFSSAAAVKDHAADAHRQ